MRIGIDIAKAQPPRDGIGNYAYHLVRALLESDDEHEYVAYGLGYPVEREWFEREFARWSDRIRLEEGPDPSPGQIDLLHGTSFSWPRNWSGPGLFTCHDLTFLTHADYHTIANRLGCLTGTLRAMVAGATFLSVSAATASVLVEQLRLPGRRIRVVHSGVDARFRPTDPAQVRQRLQERFSLEPGYVLSVGTLEPRKNLPRLLVAWAGLPDELRERCPLVVVGGQGWRNEQFEALIARQPELTEVRRLGFVEDEDLPLIYSGAGVFAYPSLAEGFGFPVLEAMACGTPVITSNTSSMPEIADGAARLVDPRDSDAIGQALDDLLTDPVESGALRERGLARARAFGWPATAAATREQYEALARPAN